VAPPTAAKVDVGVPITDGPKLAVVDAPNIVCKIDDLFAADVVAVTAGVTDVDPQGVVLAAVPAGARENFGGARIGDFFETDEGALDVPPKEATGTG